jgi:hypothetical protein
MLDSSILGAKPKERLSEEAVLAAKIQRKRDADAERRARIQHAKCAISIDKTSLDQQVAERRQQKDDERQFNISGDQGILGANRAVNLAHKEAARRRAEELRSVRDLNIEMGSQKAAERASEKHSKLHDPPTRDGDADPRLGVSSLQIFDGEDVGRAERVRQQRQQQVDWINQQKAEKEMIKRMEEEDKNQFAAEVAETTRMRGELEGNDFQVRRGLYKENLQGHVRMREEAAAERRRQREAEISQNATEQEYISNHALTAETGPQYLENGRVHRTEFKGASREEKVTVQEELMQQAAENEMARELQRQAQREDNKEARRVHGMLEGLERQKQRTRKALAAECRAENLRMQEEARARKKETNEQFSNKVSPDFHAQFGQSCR